MAFLDFIANRNAAPQQPVTPMPQPQTLPVPPVASLPDPVKAQAVEAARPAAVLIEKATTPRTAPAQPQVGGGPGRSRALGMER